MKKLSCLSLLLTPLVLSGCLSHPQTHKDPSEYFSCLETAINNSDFHSQLYIFPKDIKEESISNFAYQTRDGLFSGNYFFYLVVNYNQTEFEQELSRLDSVKASFKNGKEKSVLKYKEHSLYLTINRNERCEYVKYNEEKLEIAYVSNQIFSWDKVDISNDHLLDDVTIPSELDDGDNSYNMYYFYEGDVGWYVTD